MPHAWLPRQTAVLAAAALVAAVHGIGVAKAQEIDNALPQDASQPDGSASVDEPFEEEPLDFSLPVTAATESKLNPSRFTSGIPSSGWSAKIGVDSSPPSPSNLEIGPPLPNAPPSDQPSGAAWTSITAPSLDSPLSWEKASIDTRVDPLQDQSTLGMTFSRSLPISGDLSITLQNGYSVTGTLPSRSGAPPAPAGSSRVLNTNQALMFNILPSDTTLSVGATRSSTDPKWLPSFNAEQKLFGGPLDITGSVSETTTGELNKTVKGGFTQTW
jgi:hypothetical protein